MEKGAVTRGARATRTREALSRVEGFLAVLMKRRNGRQWTREDRAFLRRGLSGAATAVPSLAVFLLPGGFVLLPLYAWLMDRRRSRRISSVLSDSA